MKKIFTLAAALFMGLSAMAVNLANPEKTLTLPGTDSIDAWTWSKPATFYAVANDTLIVHAYGAYQSRSVQKWINCTENGSTGATWNALGSFKGSAYFGNNGGNASKLKLSRATSFKVTNCIGAAAYVKSQNSRNMMLEAYEVADGVVATEAAATASDNSNANAIINITGLDATKTYLIVIYGDNSSDTGMAYEVALVSAPAATNVATLKGLAIDGEAVADFDAATLTYNVELPFGTTTVPTVTATATQNNETVVVTPATALPGATTVVATSADGTVTTTYTINFTVSTTASTDATLKTLTINGTAVAGFKADSLNYTYGVAYVATELPVVAATVNDENATLVITQITEVPGTATVVVTAQDGTTTKTYTIAFSRLAAEKKINELILTNWYFAYSPEGTDTIFGHYIAGTEVPTILSSKISNGATLTEGTNSLTVTGVDNTTATYPFILAPVTPYAAGNDTIVFDGTEEWVKAPYGFGTTDGKVGYKFSKTDTDYSREWAGKTHFEIFLQEADTVVIFSGNSNDRDVRVRVNDVDAEINPTSSSDTKKATLPKNGKLVIPCHRSAPFCLSIRSAQSGGDGSVKAIYVKHMAADATACENVNADEKVQKVMINGQIYIIKDGVRYSVLGVKAE